MVRCNPNTGTSRHTANKGLCTQLRLPHKTSCHNGRTGPFLEPPRAAVTMPNFTNGPVMVLFSLDRSILRAPACCHRPATITNRVPTLEQPAVPRFSWFHWHSVLVVRVPTEAPRASIVLAVRQVAMFTFLNHDSPSKQQGTSTTYTSCRLRLQANYPRSWKSW